MFGFIYFVLWGISACSLLSTYLLLVGGLGCFFLILMFYLGFGMAWELFFFLAQSELAFLRSGFKCRRSFIVRKAYPVVGLVMMPQLIAFMMFVFA